MNMLLQSLAWTAFVSALLPLNIFKHAPFAQIFGDGVGGSGEVSAEILCVLMYSEETV